MFILVDRVSNAPVVSGAVLPTPSAIMSVAVSYGTVQVPAYSNAQDLYRVLLEFKFVRLEEVGAFLKASEILNKSELVDFI